jgi:hypothetical protein
VAGRLRARVSSTDGGGDGANIELHDRIFISGPLDAPIDIQISMAYDGNIVNSYHNTGAFLRLSADGQGSHDGTDTISLRDSGHYNGTLTVNIPVYPEQPYFDLYALLRTHSDAPPGDLTYVDFSQTAALSLTLPTGYSFTLESGLFLAQTLPVLVPEPGSMTPICIGLLVVGLVRCRVVSRDRTGLPEESAA